jgi:four helix bundle protein
MKSFEELRIWQDARILVQGVYSLTQNLKDYGFRDQIQRAAISIMNNIAEGADSGSDALFIRYLRIAKGSCGEVKSMLYVAENLNYCSVEQANELRSKSKLISASTQKLIDYLKQNKQNN